jgi:hypothetical protein
LARRRSLRNHPNVRATIHRFGRTSKPWGLLVALDVCKLPPSLLLAPLGEFLVRGGTAKQTDDGVPDNLYCGGGMDTVYYTPRVDLVSDDCEIENPTE